MKQKDIILIAGVVVITGVASFFLSNVLVGNPKKTKQRVEVVEKITSDFQKPDSKYFNSNSIDPTQPISIGDNNNPKPFSQTSQ